MARGCCGLLAAYIMVRITAPLCPNPREESMFVEKSCTNLSYHAAAVWSGTHVCILYVATDTERTKEPLACRHVSGSVENPYVGLRCTYVFHDDTVYPSRMEYSTRYASRGKSLPRLSNPVPCVQHPVLLYSWTAACYLYDTREVCSMGFSTPPVF